MHMPKSTNINPKPVHPALCHYTCDTQWTSVRIQVLNDIEADPLLAGFAYEREKQIN